MDSPSYFIIYSKIFSNIINVSFASIYFFILLVVLLAFYAVSCLFPNGMHKEKPLTLAGCLSWLEHCPVHQKVAGSIPSQINVSL